MANLAAANVVHRKTRTAVSVLAVGMEVAMVMLLVGLANGTLDDIADRLQNVGADILFQPPDSALLLGQTSAVMPVKYIDLIREIQGVKHVTPVLNWHVARIKGEARAVNLWAIDEASLSEISGGFVFVEGHGLEQANELLMDTILARSAEMKVGDVLHMLNREFRLAGIVRSGAGGRLYARIQDIQEAIAAPGKASFFLIKADHSNLAELLTMALRDRFKGHKITPVSQVSRLMQQNMVGLQEFKRALTAMAVAVSFLVVLLAMYTTIIERTREIGILRAIGATQGKVVQFVVTESFLICLSGVVVGILLALATRFYLMPHFFPSLIVRLTREWTVIAASLGLVGGLLGSLYPALRAARMDPIQALNFE
jgi:putative ABC transport system permease protein